MREWLVGGAVIEGPGGILLVQNRRRDGLFYEVLGKTSEGRYLQLVVEVTAEAIRIFHGRDMNNTERRRYNRK